MADSAKIFNFDDFYRSTQVPGGENIRLNPEGRIDDSASTRRETRLDDLYAPDISDALVQRVRVLLRNAAEVATDAKDALAADDAIGADQKVMILQGLLPELFCCRAVSEGMAVFVVGLFHGLKNQRGRPLNLDQIYVIAKALTAIADSPFLSFEKALDFLSGLENEEIDIDPPEAAQLPELLSIEDD